MTRNEILEAISQERGRQENLRRDGRLKFTAADPSCPQLLRLAALTEEIGEVARAVHDDTDNLIVELIQVAAVAVAWVEHESSQMTLPLG
jgi:hypothetical protein